MYEKIFKHIKINKPLFIKDYYLNEKFDKSIKEIIKLSKLSKDNNDFLKGSVYIKSENNLFINEILTELNKCPNIKIYNEYRVWNHEKNNITQWHYDGNGIDVINICFNGKKKFILTEPNSQITLPFTNITLLETYDRKYEYILEPGDLLLIPRFWFHKVISLKNETITMNFCLTNNYDTIPTNLKMLYNSHKFFNTIMNKQNICNLPNLYIKLQDFSYYFIKENILLFVLFLSIRIIIKNYLKKNFTIGNNLDKFLLLGIFTEYKYHSNSVGMSLLLLINSLFNNLLIDKLI
jgi:hypothetical protein